MSFHPNIDAEGERARMIDDETPDFVGAILAAGADISTQLGRIADHLTIENLVNEASSFGRYPAGHPADRWPEAPVDPNIATRDTASEPVRRAQPIV